MTDHRKNAVFVASGCYFISVIFLILVIIGNTSDKAVLRDIYFFKLQVANVIPLDAPNARLLNSVARSLGLHDFYQVGLWNFCEGFNDEGIVFCSTPRRFYWFNPVEILMDELLAGAKIALPTQVLTILDLLRLGQQVMWAFFIVGIVLCFILMFLTPLTLRSRGWCIPIVSFALIDSILVGGATVLATVFSVAAKYALTLQSELNIGVDLSPVMLASMWIAALLTVTAFFLHSAVGCCCHTYKHRDGECTPDSANSPRVSEKKRFSVQDFINKRRSAQTSSARVSST